MIIHIYIYRARERERASEREFGTAESGHFGHEKMLRRGVELGWFGISVLCSCFHRLHSRNQRCVYIYIYINIAVLELGVFPLGRKGSMQRGFWGGPG